MIQVTKATYIDQYKIFLVFNNKKEGVVDLKAIITKDNRPIFHELTNLEKFKKFKVEADTIVWENGLDLAPEFLYENLSK
jgi:hypothetical protein